MLFSAYTCWASDVTCSHASGEIRYPGIIIGGAVHSQIPINVNLTAKTLKLQEAWLFWKQIVMIDQIIISFILLGRFLPSMNEFSGEMDFDLTVISKICIFTWFASFSDRYKHHDNLMKTTLIFQFCWEIWPSNGFWLGSYVSKILIHNLQSYMLEYAHHISTKVCIILLKHQSFQKKLSSHTHFQLFIPVLIFVFWWLIWKEIRSLNEFPFEKIENRCFWWMVAMQQLCRALNINKRSVDQDLDVYRNLLSKLLQAKELLKEYVAR